MPSIEIGRAPAGGGPTVIFSPCDGVEVIVSMPATTVVFEVAGTRGLHQGAARGPTIMVDPRDGAFEFDDTRMVELNTTIPRQMARALYDALGPLLGRRVDRDIVANADAAANNEDPGDDNEDPQGAGRGRKLKKTRRLRQKLSRKKVWSSS